MFSKYSFVFFKCYFSMCFFLQRVENFKWTYLDGYFELERLPQHSFDVFFHGELIFDGFRTVRTIASESYIIIIYMIYIISYVYFSEIVVIYIFVIYIAPKARDFKKRFSSYILERRHIYISGFWPVIYILVIYILKSNRMLW